MRLRLRAGMPLTVIAEISPGRRVVGAITLRTRGGVTAAGRNGHDGTVVIAAIVVVGATVITIVGIVAIGIGIIRIGRGRYRAADHRSGCDARPERGAASIAAVS